MFRPPDSTLQALSFALQEAQELGLKGEIQAFKRHVGWPFLMDEAALSLSSFLVLRSSAREVASAVSEAWISTDDA